MDPLGVDKAISDLTSKTLPELLAEANQLLDRFEKLMSRLDGATVTLRLAPEK